MDVFGGAPRFLAYPRPVVVQSGTDAVLKCQIGGDPRPAVIWERNNEKIDPQGRYRVFEDGNVYNLIISAVTTEDSGQYICKAKNSIGETYAAATLKVEGEAQEMELREENKPRFLIKPLSTRVGRGEDAVFSCKLWGNPRPEVVWEKDGRKLNEIFESTHFSVGYQDGGWFQLKIFKTRAPDGGVYTCKARNEFGEALAGAVLLVDAGPGHEDEGNRNGYTNGHWKGPGKQRIGRQVPNRLRDDTMTKSTKVKMFAVTEGKHAKFRCFVTGKPKPEIIWRKDGRLILSGRRYLLYEDREGYFTLKVLYCKQKDNGVYVCAASNTAGQTLSAVHLSVKEPPVRFKQPLIDLEVWERDLAVLECEVPEDSVPITWYLEDRRLQPGAKYGMEEWGTKRRLTIRDIGVDDDGIYLCEMPDGGRSIAEVAVKGTILRKLPRKVDVLEGENAAFCVEVEKEEMDIHWYKDGVELRETHQTILKSFGRTHILVFVNTMPQDSGLVTFLVGRSKTSSQLRVKAARHCPPSCPVSVQINTERANAALLSWVPAQDSRKNPPSGYVLERQEVGTGSQEWLQCLTTDSATSVEILGDSVPCEADYRFRICSVNKYGKSNNVEFPKAVHLVPVARIQAPLQDALVPEGQDALFSIELSASVIGTWFLNGTQLQEDERFSMRRTRTHQSLRIRGVRDTDNGAEITFIAYGIRDSAALYIQAPLVKFSSLSEMDRNKFVEVGNPIVLYCELSDPAAPVHWYKNGVELQTIEGLHIQSEGTMRRIVIQSAEFSHSGVYCCDAIDDVIRFNVEVEALPVKFSDLEESDRNKSVQEGSPIVLSCELSHDPSAHVDWYKDGTKLLPQHNMEIQSDGLTRTLHIHSAEDIHGGTYECSTSDDTITFTVEVKGRSPQIMPIPQSEKYKMITIGCPIILQCEVSDPVAQVSWFKDEVELFCRTGLDMKRDGSLRKLMINSAKVSDSGLYSCSLIDDVVTFHVDIEETPVRFSALPEVARNKFVEAGCPIMLQCEVSEPTAKVYWQKDGEQLLPKSDYEIQKKEKLRAVVIKSAEVRHSGLYSCEAADDHIKFKVDVAAVPEAERSESIEAGSPINLQCEISDPTNQTCLYDDGPNLLPELGINIDSEGNKRTLVTKSATSSCSGVYSCKTDDDDDSDFNDYFVEVKAPPVTFADIPEEDLFKSVVEQEQLVLSCELSRADGVVQWYKDGTELQPSDNVTMLAEGPKRNLTIHSAQLSDTGTYTCRAGDNVLMFKVNIREPPVMIVFPKEDVHLERHVPEEIILSCELSRPNGVVSWYKDGQKLQESENIKLKIEGPYRRLKILSSGVEDSGEYVCDTADDSIFFHLNITEPPVRIVSPSQSQMELCQQTSERMVLSCEISRPNAVVRWYRDGLEVEENDNLILEVDGVYRRLIIPETTVKDSAEYVCDTADDSMTFFVNIAEPPVRFVRPRKMASRVEKVAGETLVLDCEVSRSNAEVTWKKNGEEVEDSRNITILEDGVVRQLTVHSLTLEDAGQYVCDAKDDVMDFNVKVQDLPVKILGKTDAKTEKQFLVSDDIILVCELSRSNASVSWYKDNQLIDDTERYCSEEQGVFRSLVVLNAELEDSGEYTCDAVDDKMVFYITVKEPPVQIIGNSGHPEHHILVAGDDLILECEVSRPNATVQWLCNGKTLKPDTRIQIDSHDVVRKLVLSGLQPSDSGKYICDAIDDKLITIVEVQEPPVTFVDKEAYDDTISAYENESVTLYATVNRERANVRWLKDGQLLNEDNIHISSEGNTHKLTINPLQLSDSGEYVCDASTDEMYFSLLVKEMKVKFIRPLENIASLKGSSLILRCEISKPKGDVQWLKDGQEISPSRRHTIRAQGRERSFTIHQLVEEDAGEYACESTDDRTSATVTIEIPRVVEFIAELRNITVCEGEDAVFKCVVSPEDTQLVWRLNGKQVALNERTVISSNGLCHMLCIHNCMVSDSGKVTADAEGSVSEAELKVQEQQVLFTKKMTPVVAEEYNEATLEVEVSLDSEELQWMRQGVLIHPGPKYTLKHKGLKHSLTIHKLSMSDRGTYSCETLHDRTQAQLTVEPRKITIKRGLTDIKTTERETASFEVELSHPQVTGTWMRNGIQLKPTSHFRMSAKGQVHSLTISNLSVEDTATFTFSVEHLKTSARLVVKEPPVTIFRKLEDQRFPDGAVISIECELSRHNVDVKWMKNGVEVKPGKDLRIYAMGRKRFLQIVKCNVSDSGIYTCDAGDATTSCTVEVYERELLIQQGLEDLDIQEDQNAVFVCEISVEDVPGEWYKNGERIQPTSTIKIRQEGTKHFLLMCNVRAEDSGEIKFVARHVESVAYLEVEELPVNIVKPLQDKTAIEKSRVILDCTVSNPRCSIRWYKGVSVVLPSERFEICSEGGYRKLIIQQVALEDEGTYSVQVGEYSCSAKLTVEAQSLLMVRELKDVEVMAPDNACFECEVSAPVAKAPVWSLNGEPLQSSSQVRLEKMGTVHRLTLLQTSPDMSGEVEFTSGKATSTAQLRVLSDP
ncbi:obscurin-like protein 1 isoform X2 [Sparus aurata]|uniref:obscurin-like protein 1 isoform X2 n=1 Tax=Sparus aurata TaxID=8175 RepID=UPI0011C0EB86|nr:obscurin-like protein 1 isoform X2 [Sparus aurata]